jgi:hypothetical protein
VALAPDQLGGGGRVGDLDPARAAPFWRWRSHRTSSAAVDVWATSTRPALRRSGADPKALRRALRRIEELLDE